MVWSIPFLILFILTLWGFVSSNLIVKMPKNTLDFNPKSLGYEFESFRCSTEDKIEIAGWFVPAKTKTNCTILVLHGWGANRSDAFPATTFLAQKYNLAYFDFRNHGRSGGNRTSLTCLEIKDFLAVVKFLRKEKKELCENIGVFGFSMGGSVAISGSVEMPEIKAVIAESPFSSYNETVARFAKIFYGIPKFMVPPTLWFTRMRLSFDPEKCSPIYHISKIAPRPIFIIQGGGDIRMPVAEGEALYHAAKEPKEIWVVPGADHGAIQETTPDEYKKRILNFFEKWMKN